MNKIRILTAVATALTLTANVAMAQDDMEKCKVVKDGKGLIKEHKADCKTASHSCAGQNKEGDPEAWIYVPKGQCEKINTGDLTGIPGGTRDKLQK